MKNRLSIGLVTLGFLVPLAVLAASASFSLSPSKGSFTVGAAKTVNVYMEPSEGTVYTAKVTVHFPPNLLHVKSFTPASGTMPLIQPGYDLVDNAGGVLIKTVGFPGGAKQKTLVGTIVFSPIQSGNADVTVSSESLALDAKSANIASSFGSAHFAISAGKGGVKIQPTEPAAVGEAGAATSAIAFLPAPVCGMTFYAVSLILVILAFILGILTDKLLMRKKSQKKSDKK